MTVFNLVATLLGVVAFLSYLNDRLIRLPSAIGLMVISLATSLGLVALGAKGYPVEEPVRNLLAQADFSEMLMNGMLCFLLFAGAIQFRIKDLAQQKWVIALLATVGVAASTFITGSLLYWGLQSIQVPLPYIYCLIFGALISPTDPVALLAILKHSKTPKSLEIKIAGESLFNDGVAVVLFTILVGMATGKAQTLDPGQITDLLFRQIVGGVMFGLLLGWTAYRFLKDVREFPVEVLITLATACGGYALAHTFNFSGPITVVCAALVIGNMNRGQTPPPRMARMQLEQFWELINELMNAVLFVWIGLAVLAFEFTRDEFRGGMAAVPVALMGRFLGIWAAVWVFGFRHEFTRRGYWLMTWGGIRGGISVAMALSLPASGQQDFVLTITYVTVVFSIVCQGLTIGWFVEK